MTICEIIISQPCFYANKLFRNIGKSFLFHSPIRLVFSSRYIHVTSSPRRHEAHAPSSQLTLFIELAQPARRAGSSDHFSRLKRAPEPAPQKTGTRLLIAKIRSYVFKHTNFIEIICDLSKKIWLPLSSEIEVCSFYRT